MPRTPTRALIKGESTNVHDAVHRNQVGRRKFAEVISDQDVRVLIVEDTVEERFEDLLQYIQLCDGTTRDAILRPATPTIDPVDAARLWAIEESGWIGGEEH